MNSSTEGAFYVSLHGVGEVGSWGNQVRCATMTLTMPVSGGCHGENLTYLWLLIARIPGLAAEPAPFRGSSGAGTGTGLRPVP